MTRAAEPADAAGLTDVPVEAKLLADGEIVILSIKPSPWFVLLSSAPVLILAAAIAAGTVIAQQAQVLPDKYRAVYLLAAAVACVRLAAACVQWLGLRYVLTDRRILRLRTLPATTVFELTLDVISEAAPSVSLPARLLRVGDVAFLDERGRPFGVAWVCVANCRTICGTINQAIQRHRR